MVDETRDPGRTGYRYESPSVQPEVRTPTGDGAGDAGRAASERTEEVTSKAGEMVDQVKSMGGDAANRAKDAAESGRESTADALDRAATTMKDRAGDGMTGAAMEKAAGGVEAAAGYLKEHETGEIWDDLERYIREHPMQAVAAAVATGIVVGRVLR